jgi:hypothetical protein
MKALLLVALGAAAIGCGSSPPSQRPVPRPRATMVWDTGGECLPRSEDADPCVHLTAGDVSVIREAIITRLRGIKDMPDLEFMLRLAERPIAQWTASTYDFEARRAADHPGDAMLLTVREQQDGGMVAGFRCVLARAGNGWEILDLSSYAAM